jgi:hypothetical protein
MLDQEMIESRGNAIAPRLVPAAALPIRSGAEVAAELGDRLLVRYMLRNQVRRYSAGSTVEHFVTPTPLAASDLVSVLALPAPQSRRTFGLLLKPWAIPEIKGPRWVRGGTGIEYILPFGFPPEAVLRWELKLG